VIEISRPFDAWSERGTSSKLRRSPHIRDQRLRQT